LAFTALFYKKAKNLLVNCSIIFHNKGVFQERIIAAYRKHQRIITEGVMLKIAKAILKPL
jgi:hypothetical protein